MTFNTTRSIVCHGFVIGVLGFQMDVHATIALICVNGLVVTSATQHKATRVFLVIKARQSLWESDWKHTITGTQQRVRSRAQWEFVDYKDS